MAKFCIYCGASINEGEICACQRVEERPKAFCVYCGKQIYKGDICSCRGAADSSATKTVYADPGSFADYGAGRVVSEYGDDRKTLKFDSYDSTPVGGPEIYVSTPPETPAVAPAAKKPAGPFLNRAGDDEL